jgi:LPXTG-site transpeptidase (sortase) family protein
MKESIIFLIIFLVIFSASVFIFNGRFIYAQIKYSAIGPPSLSDLTEKVDTNNSKVGYSPLPKAEHVLPEKLAIPSLGIEAPIVMAQSDNEVALQKDLERGVILLPGSSNLNQKGTMVIMGHSSAYPWYKGQYGSIFALLNKLNVNDEIIVFSKDKQYIYKVLGKEIKAPKDLVFQTQENEPILYLVSCWPVNTAWKRIVIKTVQVLDKE